MQRSTSAWGRVGASLRRGIAAKGCISKVYAADRADAEGICREETIG